MPTTEPGDIETQIKEIFGVAFRVDPSGLTRDTVIAAELPSGSIFRVNLVALIENRLDVAIPLSDASAAATVGEVVDLVAARMV